jgi:hypothetical protein
MPLYTSLRRMKLSMANDNYWLKIATYDLKTAEAMI